jgi:hypothetical protein
MTHDPIWAEHAHLLWDAFPQFQFVVVDDSDVVAVGHAIPFGWDGDIVHRPDGIDGVLPAAAADLAAGTPRRRCRHSGAALRRTVGAV